MLRHCGIVLAVVGTIASSGLRADDAADVVKMQKETAQSHWKTLFGDDALVQQETPHLLLYGPVSVSERQLKALGTALEGQLALARKALQFEAKDEFWTGKLSVYVFDQRGHLTSFMRGVEKRRPQPEDLGTFALEGNHPHIAAGPPTAKHDPSMEQQASEQLGAALLSKKAGKDLPQWVIAGFGRATAWRAAPAAYSAERLQVKKLARTHYAKDVWGDSLKPEEAPLLQASVVDYLAYGGVAKSFPAFLEAFKSDEENPRQKTRKPAGEALKAIKLSPDRLNQGWQAWVAAGR